MRSSVKAEHAKGLKKVGFCYFFTPLGKYRTSTKETRGGPEIDVISLATGMNASGNLVADWSFGLYSVRDW